MTPTGTDSRLASVTKLHAVRLLSPATLAADRNPSLSPPSMGGGALCVLLWLTRARRTAGGRALECRATIGQSETKGRRRRELAESGVISARRRQSHRAQLSGHDADILRNSCADMPVSNEQNLARTARSGSIQPRWRAPATIRSPRPREGPESGREQSEAVEYRYRTITSMLARRASDYSGSQRHGFRHQ